MSSTFERRVCAVCSRHVADGHGLQDLTDRDDPKVYHSDRCYSQALDRQSKRPTEPAPAWAMTSTAGKAPSRTPQSPLGAVSSELPSKSAVATNPPAPAPEPAPQPTGQDLDLFREMGL